MGYKIGTAAGHEDLLEQFRKWITGTGTNATPVADPGNVGGGSLASVITTPSTITETITAVCTNATVPAEFTISGSVSGVFGTVATAGVAYLNSKIGFTITASGTAFALDDAFTIAVTEGQLKTEGVAWDQLSTTVPTTYKAAAAYSRSSGNYAITIPYHDIAIGESVSVTLNGAGAGELDGTYTVTASTPLTAVATITIPMAATYSGGAMPTSGTVNVTLNETHIFLKGKGNGGTDEIFVQLRSYNDVGEGYYNIELRGADGFDQTATDRLLMPNVSPLADICLTGAAMDYWFIANGRRFCIVAKVGTYYDSCYAGFILPTGLPSEWPYPLFIGGSSNTKKTLNSATGTRSAFFENEVEGQPYLLKKDGAWQSFKNSLTYEATGAKVHPNKWSFGYTTTTAPVGTFRSCLYNGTIDPVNSTYQLFPCSLMNRVTSPSVVADIYGDLQGVYRVGGYQNSAGNIVTVGGVQHLVVPNVYRSGEFDYAAFRLE